MNIGNILKTKINKDKIYNNIVNNSKKSNILRIVVPLGIVFTGVSLFYLLRKDKVK